MKSKPKMKPKLTRYHNTIIAEVYAPYEYEPGKTTEILICRKDFNEFLGDLFGIKPTQKTYDKAKKWADDVIALHLKNTEQPKKL